MKLHTKKQIALVAMLGWATSSHTFSQVASETTVLERGASHKIVQNVTWQTNGFGDVTARTNKYTELATGLNYQDNGEWKESRAEIEILNDGTGAIGAQTGHKVRFKPNLNSDGVIQITTPDGKVMRSQIFGLGYYDRVTKQSEIIAIVKDAEGELHGDNEVVYPDAFNGVDADVRFRYTRAGIEQDVILRSQPPKPHDFGLNITNTQLEVFTEFIVTNEPAITTATIPGTQMTDDKLKFGKMVLGRGRAFPVGEENDRRRSVPTGKMWIPVDDRRVLLEAVEYKAVKKELDALPELPRTAALTTKPKSFLASNGRKIPAKPTASATASKARFKKQSRLASLESRNRDGYVLDYIAVQEWTEDQHAIFESGETYLISAGYWPNEITFEAGTVIKFADDTEYGGFGHTLGVMGAVHCPESGTATLTSVHDNSVGETIDTSPRDPNVAAVYLEMAWGNPPLKNLKFKEAYVAIYGGSELVLSNVTFVDCQMGILGSGPVAMTNVTAFDCMTLVDYSWSGNVSCALNCSKITGQASGDLVLYDFGASLAGVSLVLDRSCMDGFTQNITTLGTSITAANGTFSWTRLCSPYDTDQDGLLDSWEQLNFGNLNHTDTGDFDGDGTSNYDEHQAGTNPNDIQFIARFENLWVSNRTVSGYCEMEFGKPALMKVLVNSTDLSTVSWQSYNSNFTATLPDLDTNHTVLIALRGFAATNTPVTDNTELTLDRVPPMLVITNPALVSAAATVVKPYLQLQGYGDEPLAYRMYDLTNEFRCLSNESVSSVGKYFDKDKFDYTTNFFQAYDIPLATNTNLITLIVCDRAGNVTRTNITVTLDLGSDAEAPELSLIWPTNDMQICGESFYMRGRISDETATLVAQQVDGDGVITTVTGIVERNGMFWVEDVPLTVGQNEWTIIATDAAGNVSSTNLSVTKSIVSLTIDSTPTGDALYEPVGSVSGTVSDASYSVIVNGVAASVDQNGNWSANDVPIYGMGTATFDATATQSSGGGSGQPSVSKEIEKKVRWIISEHHVNELNIAYFSDYMRWNWSWEKNYFHHLEWNNAKKDWVNKFNADATEVNDEVLDYPFWYNGEYLFSSADLNGALDWADPSGSYHYNSIGENESWKPMSIPHKRFAGISGPDVIFFTQYFAKNTGNIFFYPNGGFHELSVGATTSYKLYTGGKGTVSRDNFFRLYATAEEYHPMTHINSWHLAPNTPISPLGLEVDGKSADSTGVVWKKYADNTEQDITVFAKGKKHYKASVSPYKYCLISRCECPRKDLDRTTVGVAEKVSLYWSSTSAGLDSIAGDYPIEWSNSGGKLTPKNTWPTSFTAPCSKESVTLTAKVGGEPITRTFETIEPTGIKATIRNKECFSSPRIAVGVEFDVILQPTTVSFANVQVIEPAEPTTTTGYYSSCNCAPTHAGSGAGNWQNIDCNNRILGPPVDAFDHAWLSRGDEWLGHSGSFTWPIHARWRVSQSLWPDCPENQLSGWTDQKFTLGSDGTLIVEKFGQTVTRGRNENCSH